MQSVSCSVTGNAHRLEIDSGQMAALMRQPHQTIAASAGGIECTMKIAIPDYDRIITEHYRDIVAGDLQAFCSQVGVPFGFRHFGLEIDFAAPVEIFMHDQAMAIDDTVRELMRQFGPVIIRNAYLGVEARDQGHRNRFPHLNFHIDRSKNQEAHLSLFTRNPFDSEQIEPRTSSTLFIANIVGYLQCMKEGLCEAGEKGMRTHYDLFAGEGVHDLINTLILEHAWDAPHGVGEMSMQDNCVMLHASYYRNASKKGYRIGVRYVK